MPAPDQENPTDPAGQVSFFTKLIATGLFSGYIPWASGTFGSLVGVGLYFAIDLDTSAFAILIAVAFLAGVFTSSKIAAIEGTHLSKTSEFAKEKFQPDRERTPDPSIVVIDEIVGMWIALFFLPKTLLAASLAFILFRIFDIVKPFPTREAERLPKGWGIMLDDVVAGLYANITARIILFIFTILIPKLF